MIINLDKKLFYILIFLLPANLGYHFVRSWSYVDGILIDYLIPTIFVQDILVFLILLIWLFRTLINPPPIHDTSGWIFRWLFLFLFCVFISIFISYNVYASIYAFLRLILYALFSIYVLHAFDFNLEWEKMLKILAFSVFFVSILGLIQWFKQGAVFNNYIFFGEQPYNSLTNGISREHLFNKVFIPVYGTFRHPNIFAGFLCVTLLWFYIQFRHLHAYKALLALGITVLFLTFSYIAIFTFLTSIIFYHAIKKYGSKIYKYLFVFLLVFALSSIALPYITDRYFSNFPSFYRRVYLLENSLQYLKLGYYFGTGINTSTEYAFDNVQYFGEMKYLQPVHNVFVLILVESGVFALIFFILFIIFIFFGLHNRSDDKTILFLLTFFQIILLSLFDHYLYTIHQTFLLFWLTVGFYFAYNKSLL